MTVLASDASVTQEIGEINEFLCVASDIFYEGAMIGDNASGIARPIVAGDKFLGFAESHVDNSAGAEGAKSVRVIERGKRKMALTGATIRDLKQPVYAADDGTLTFDPTGGSYVGRVHRFVSSGVVVIAFDATRGVDPYGDRNGLRRELVSANKTLDAQDTGKIFFVDTDGVVITIPATATALRGVKIVNIGAFGAVGLSVSPAAADKVMGPDLAGTDDKDIINTKATARRGDYVVLSNGHADGPVVEEMRGIWAEQG